MMVTVSKVGGTSGKDGKTLEHVITKLIIPNPERRVWVFSAPGKRYPEDYKVTDILFDIAQETYGNFSSISPKIELYRERLEVDFLDYFRIPPSFLDSMFTELSNLLRIQDPNEKRYFDRILPQGERNHVRIAEKVMRDVFGINAKAYFPEQVGLITDGNFGAAKVDRRSYKKIGMKLIPVLRNTNQIILFPGYYGVFENDLTTLGDGSSDVTGAVTAISMNADLYENYTDTDGIYRADPRIVKGAETIEILTYDEARELRVQVLHADTLLPLLEKNIPMRVRNTLNPNNEGTLIVEKRKVNQHTMEGISYTPNCIIINTKRLGMGDISGYRGKIIDIVADYGFSIASDASQRDAHSIVIAEPQYRGNRKKEQQREFYRRIGELKKALKNDRFLRPDQVKIDRDGALVYCVGQNMEGTPGIAGKVFGAVGDAGVNIKYISQGTSEYTISFGVNNSDISKTVNAVYNAFFPHAK